MVVLLVTHHIGEAIDGEVLETLNGRTNILGHVHRGTIAAKHEFFVQPVFPQINPNGTVVPTVKNSALNTSLNVLLAQQVGFGFVVVAVKCNAEPLVCCVEACIDPLIHGGP